MLGSQMAPDAPMSLGAAIAVVAEALRDAMTVNPWLAALWLGAAVALGVLLVYTWRRLARP